MVIPPTLQLAIEVQDDLMVIDPSIEIVVPLIVKPIFLCMEDLIVLPIIELVVQPILEAVLSIVGLVIQSVV